MPTPIPPEDGHWLNFVGVLTVGLSVLFGVIGMIWLNAHEIAISDHLDRVVTLLAGGLLGFLVRGAVTEKPPTDGVQEQ